MVMVIDEVASHHAPFPPPTILPSSRSSFALRPPVPRGQWCAICSVRSSIVVNCSGWPLCVVLQLVLVAVMDGWWDGWVGGGSGVGCVAGGIYGFTCLAALCVCSKLDKDAVYVHQPRMTYVLATWMPRHMIPTRSEAGWHACSIKVHLCHPNGD